MSRFIISNENAQEVVKVCKPIVARDAKVVLNLGLQDMGENVYCGVQLSTGIEQIQYFFLSKKPEDFDGAAIKVAVNAHTFISIVETVLAFKEDIFIEPESTMLVIGVSDKAKSSVAIEAQAPSDIPATQPIFRMAVTGKELAAVLTRGCSFASDEKDATHNSILQLIPSEDKIKGYSTDGNTIACCGGKVKFTKVTDNTPEKAAAKINAMNEELAKVAEKNGLDKEKYPLILPKEGVLHLAGLVSGFGDVEVALQVDENHVHLKVGNTLIYTITQAAEARVPVEYIDNMVNLPANATYGVDAAKLSDAVGFINRNNAIVGNKDISTSVTVDGEDLVVSSGISSQFETRLHAASIDSFAELSVDGEKFKTAVDTMNRGNLVVKVTRQDNVKFVTLLNGTPESADTNSFIMLLMVLTQKVEESADEGEDESESAAE